MKVILKKTNQVEEVSFGYAVNYLFPKGLAVKATDKNLKQIAQKKALDFQKKEDQQAKDKVLANKLNNQKITLKLKTGKTKKTYGSLGKKQILNALKLTKNQVEVLLPKPIKKIGLHSVDLKIGKEKAKIKIEVVKEK